MRAAPLGIVVLALVALAGCQTQDDSTTLSAVFDDVRHLAPQHAVRIADTRVGTVTGIELDGLRARVTFDVQDGHPVPAGTTAAIRQTSLLGENYVELRLPDDMTPVLTDGDTIQRTETVVELEDLVRASAEVLGAIDASDVDVVLEAATTGIEGQGDRLGRLLDRMARLSEEYADAGDDLGQVLDGLGGLGRDLAPSSQTLAQAIDESARAAETSARQRDRLVAALENLASASGAINRSVLDPHGGALSDLLADLRPVTRLLADQRGELNALIEQTARFGQRFPQAVRNDQVQVYAHLQTESRAAQPLTDVIALLQSQLPVLDAPS